MRSASSLLVLALLSDVPARAEPADCERRLQFIEQTLSHARRRALAWSLSWGALYTSLTALELGLLPTAKDRGDYATRIVGAGGAFVGVVVVVALPPKEEYDAPRLSRLLGGARADRCALLPEAERVLERDAGSEAFGTSPLIHAGNFVFNIGLGLILGLGFDRWHDAATTMLVGIAVGELQTITRPLGLQEALRRYRHDQLEPRASRPRPQWAVRPQLGRQQQTLELVVAF